MKVLVTGAAGQIGRAVVGSAPASCELVPLTRADLDITDPDAVAACIETHRPVQLINAAAYTNVDRAESEPDEAHRVNASGAGHLARAAAACGARLIQLSTDFVFDGAADRPYTPQMQAVPLNVYGRSKLAGEQAVLAALPRSSVLLRTARVYSASGHNFLLTMLSLMRRAEPVRVVADQVGTPTSAASVAGTIWALAARPRLGGIHHWTDAGSASWHEFAVAIMHQAVALGLLEHPIDLQPISSEDYGAAAQRPRFSVLDTRATSQAVGITPRHWRDELEDVMREIANA